MGGKGQDEQKTGVFASRLPVDSSGGGPEDEELSLGCRVSCGVAVVSVGVVSRIGSSDVISGR